MLPNRFRRQTRLSIDRMSVGVVVVISIIGRSDGP